MPTIFSGLSVPMSAYLLGSIQRQSSLYHAHARQRSSHPKEGSVAGRDSTMGLVAARAFTPRFRSISQERKRQDC